MSAGSARPLVCGFFDLAGGSAGLAWKLGESGGLLLEEDDVLSAGVEISERGDDLNLEMKTKRSDVDVRLQPRPALLELETAGNGTPPYSLEFAPCAATVRGKGRGRGLQCPGHLSRWAAPLEAVATLRHLSIEGPEGSMLVIVARGERGAAHGEEEIAAWRLDREGGFESFAEALLSTQYDESGRQTRMGLELWREGEEQADRAAATRGAGTRLGGTEDSAGPVSAALMRCSVEGNRGLGSYLIRRG
jgi:hypothetical protein